MPEIRIQQVLEKVPFPGIQEKRTERKIAEINDAIPDSVLQALKVITINHNPKDFPLEMSKVASQLEKFGVEKLLKFDKYIQKILITGQWEREQFRQYANVEAFINSFHATLERLAEHVRGNWIKIQHKNHADIDNLILSTYTEELKQIRSLLEEARKKHPHFKKHLSLPRNIEQEIISEYLSTIRELFSPSHFQIRGSYRDRYRAAFENSKLKRELQIRIALILDSEARK